MRKNSVNAFYHRSLFRNIILGIFLVALFLTVGFLLFSPITIKANGQEMRVERDSTLGDLLEREAFKDTLKPGNLIAVDGSLLEEGQGHPFTCFINGEEVTDTSHVISGADTIELSDGTDMMEDYTTTRETIPFDTVTTNKGGSIHLLSEGQEGIRETKTGTISGISITEDIQPKLNAGLNSYTVNTTDKVLALTFDDGPWPETTAAILDLLKQYNVKATFFTIGEQIADRASLVKREIEEGHQVATHSWDHASGSGQGVNLTYMTPEEQIQEIQQGYESIAKVTGTMPSAVIRSPGGNFYGSLVTTLTPYVEAEINWTIDTEDWKRPGVESIVAAVKEAVPGDIILMHDGGGDRTQTVEALRQVLPQLLAQGYSFVTIDELLDQYQEQLEPID